VRPSLPPCPSITRIFIVYQPLVLCMQRRPMRRRLPAGIKKRHRHSLGEYGYLPDTTFVRKHTYRGRRLVPNQPAYASKSILAKRLLNVNNRLRRTCRRLCFPILPFADGNDATPPPQPTGAEQRKAPPLPPPEWHEWCQTVSAAPPDAWGRCRGYHPARNA